MSGEEKPPADWMSDAIWSAVREMARTAVREAAGVAAAEREMEGRCTECEVGAEAQCLREQRDRLLVACRMARPHIRSILNMQSGVTGFRRESAAEALDAVLGAIADAEV